MRRTTSSWHSTFAKLGFKKSPRRRSSGSRRTLGYYSRTLHAEPLEDRRMLAVITVNTPNDELDHSTGNSSLSLREAIEVINYSSTFLLADGELDQVDDNTEELGQNDRIVFDLDAMGSGMIQLSKSGELVINSSLTISGPEVTVVAYNPTATEGDGSRIFSIYGSSVVASLEGLTLTGGDVWDSGAAIYAQNVILSLSDLTITDNHAMGDGGGIYYWASSVKDYYFSASGTDFIDNSAGNSGGGLYVYSASTVEIDGGMLSGNEATAGSGGGAYLYSIPPTQQQPDRDEGLRIANAVVSGNISAVQGGGLYLSRGTQLLQNVRIINQNESAKGGGVFSYLGPNGLYVKDSTISGNIATSSSGGGMYVSTTFGDGPLNVAGSTFAYNHADSTTGKGGGLFVRDGNPTWSTSLDQSTFYQNTSGAAGGALYFDLDPSYSSRQVLRNVTITKNQSPSGAGLGSDISGLLYLVSTIVSGNTTNGSIASNIQGTVDAASSYNLLGPIGTDGGLSGSNENIIRFDNDPLLGALTMANGGVTPTSLPLNGSDAIDHGDPSYWYVANEFDQRGGNHPRVLNGRMDIGAVESSGEIVSPPPITQIYDLSEFVNNLDFEEFNSLPANYESMRAFDQTVKEWRQLSYATADYYTSANGNPWRGGQLEVTLPTAVNGSEGFLGLFRALAPYSDPAVEASYTEPWCEYAVNVLDEPLVANRAYAFDLFAGTGTGAPAVAFDGEIVIYGLIDASSLPGASGVSPHLTRPVEEFYGSNVVELLSVEVDLPAGEWTSFINQTIRPMVPIEAIVIGSRSDTSNTYVLVDAAAPTSIPALLGDYNEDGSVDAADYTVWRDNLGSQVTNPFDGADGNGNGAIDIGDYAVWKANYGNIAAAAALQIVTIPGDYNSDGEIDAADYTVWRDNEGAIVTPYSSADASGNGVVDQADYIIWKTNYGETTASFHDPSVVADYDRDGEVGQSDYDLWETTLGSTIDLSADGNRNGVVDMADLDVWQEYRGVTVADTVAGDYNNNGIVDVADYDLWKDTYGSTTILSADGNGDGVVDAADYTIWRNNLGMTTAAIWPTILGGGSGVPLEVPNMAPQVVGFTLSGSNSAHPAFDFDSVVGSGEQLRSVPVGGIDSVTITFSEEVFVLNADLTLTNLEGTTLPAIAEFSYDLDSHSATWQFSSVLPVGQYLVQLSDNVIDLDQDALDGEFSNPWSLVEAAGYASTFPSGDGTAGGEFRFRFTNLAADYNGNNIVEGTDDDVWFSNFNQSGKTSTRQGDGDGNGITAYSNDFILFQNQYGKNYTAWPSIEPGMILVSTLVDESDGNYSYGDLSLREAIALAGSAAGDDTIVFAPGLTGTIYLNSVLAVTTNHQGNVTIDGPGSDVLTVDATNSWSGAFQVYSGTHIEKIVLKDLRVTGSTVAVMATGADFEVVLERMNFTGNWGTITYMYGGGNLTILDSEIADNQASNIIEFWGGSTGHLTIGNSSILDNYGVGTLLYGGTADIFNTTYSGNYISDPSGGIWVEGADVTVSNCTITDNEGEGGGGIYVSSGGNVTLHNSIVVGNRVNGSALDIYTPGYQGGTFDSGSSNNLIGVDATSTPSFPSGSNDNQVGVTTNDLKLAPLGYYGGPTRTHMLLEDSVAIDAGNNSQALDGEDNKLIRDQRGLTRITGTAIDIGAVEASSGSLLTIGTLTDENDSDHSPADFSLREAMDLASDLYGVETIQFDPALSGTLTLSLGQLTIDTDLEITGPGADQVTISGNNASRVVYQSYQNPVTSATIRDLRIADGSASTSSGGGISSFGELTLERVAIEDNYAATGGGIFSSGTLTMTNCTVADNTATYIGGGVQLGSADAPATITNSTISSNSSYYNGGGLYVSSSPLTLAHSTVTQNHSTGVSYGGGIAIYNSNVILHHSIVADNFASGSTESDIYGSLDAVFSRYNLIGTGDSGGLANGVNGNLVGVADPGLTSLDYHGGPLRTHALLDYSLAIDAGDQDLSGAPLTDERGEDRIVDWLGDDLEATIDIGAVELAVDEIYS